MLLPTSVWTLRNYSLTNQIVFSSITGMNLLEEKLQNGLNNNKNKSSFSFFSLSINLFERIYKKEFKKKIKNLIEKVTNTNKKEENILSNKVNKHLEIIQNA